MRRVGVELEMGGLDIARISALVADCLGGTVRVMSNYEHAVDGDPAGDWRVELDFAFLQALGRRELNSDAPFVEVQQLLEHWLHRGAEQVVPMEVVSPPLPLNELVKVDRLIVALRSAGARGTTDNLMYAFGLHLNPELPALDATSIRHYMQAFVCLYDWLLARSRVDLMRRMTAFAEAFDQDYVRKLVAADYQPDLPALIDDYLLHNPSRNRALDMLPLFTHLDPQRVKVQVQDKLIKPRPTLHYRLPNCEIDQPGWGLRGAWSDWLMVERLVAAPSELAELCDVYGAFLAQPLERWFGDWLAEVEVWLSRHPDL